MPGCERTRRCGWCFQAGQRRTCVRRTEAGGLPGGMEGAVDGGLDTVGACVGTRDGMLR